MTVNYKCMVAAIYNDFKLCQIEIVNIMCVCVICVYIYIERIYNVVVAMRQW